MKLSTILIEKFRDIETNSRGKLFGHILSSELRLAEALSAKIERDGHSVVYLFPDRSRLKVTDPLQCSGKAHFYILSNVG
jgi:hypothetical protein